eukprot:SAG31_NODE_14215_length_820_cov_1.395284_1_plen_218_part_01
MHGGGSKDGFDNVGATREMVAQVMARKLCNMELGGGLRESKKSVIATGAHATRQYLESKLGAFDLDGCVADVCIPACLLRDGRAMKEWLPHYLQRYRCEPATATVASEQLLQNSPNSESPLYSDSDSAMCCCCCRYEMGVHVFYDDLGNLWHRVVTSTNAPRPSRAHIEHEQELRLYGAYKECKSVTITALRFEVGKDYEATWTGTRTLRSTVDGGAH